MKKHILTIAFVVGQMATTAQTVNVHFKNGQTIEYPSASVDYVDFSEKPSDPTLTPGQVVDLGLSVYWASCNLGANNPEEYGNYYAWGETSPKDSYYSDTYSYYNTSTTQYINIGDDISGTAYDAATVNLGSDWRMPTKSDAQELINQCTWEWKQFSGINGYVVTGPNGNSIFLPASGVKGRYSTTGLNEYFYFWTATNSSQSSAVFLFGSSGSKSVSGFLWEKYNGFSIRPVTSNRNAGH